MPAPDYWNGLATNLFDAAYQGTPPWDIGRPQSFVVTLADSGRIRGTVLDVGCGTGENALYLAAGGHEVVGIDSAPTAIEKARTKAIERGLDARFEVADALNLPAPPEPYDTVIDSGLFHVFDDEDRLRFRDSLRGVLRVGSVYFMSCFSEHVPGNWGPRRVTQDEIRSTFAAGWHVDAIEPSTLDTNFGPVQAWLASISKS